MYPTYITTSQHAGVKSPLQQLPNLEMKMSSRYPNHIHRTNPACSFRGSQRHAPMPAASFVYDPRNPPAAAAVADNGFGNLQGFPTRLRESATNILGSVARISSSIFQSGIEMAQAVLGDIDQKSREDIITFNGFMIKVFGDALTLDSVHVNGDGGDDDGEKRLSVKVKVGNEVNVKYAHPVLGDNRWTLNFPAVDAFIQIQAPLGVNSDTMSWECGKPSDDGSNCRRVLTVTVL